jgi:hypothetical protein
MSSTAIVITLVAAALPLTVSLFKVAAVFGGIQSMIKEHEKTLDEHDHAVRDHEKRIGRLEGRGPRSLP